MNTQDYGKIDLDNIEREARRLRARYLAEFFQRRNR
jgi:hypothetical protein